MDHHVALFGVVDVVAADHRLAAVQDEHLGVIGLAAERPHVEGDLGLDPGLGERLLHRLAEGVEVPVVGDVDLEVGVLGLLGGDGLEQALSGLRLVVEDEGLDADLELGLVQQGDHLVDALVLGVDVVEPDVLDRAHRKGARALDRSLVRLEDGLVHGRADGRATLRIGAQARIERRGGARGRSQGLRGGRDARRLIRTRSGINFRQGQSPPKSRTFLDYRRSRRFLTSCDLKGRHPFAPGDPLQSKGRMLRKGGAAWKSWSSEVPASSDRPSSIGFWLRAMPSRSSPAATCPSRREPIT
ncbi:hypothetical protein D3C86_1433420 [compost metagenome]